MKTTDIRWKGMHPANLMHLLVDHLGSDDPQQLANLLNTNPSRLLLCPGVGRKTIKRIAKNLNAVGFTTRIMI